MRKVIATEYLTLDGVMEAPEKWSLQFWNDEAARYKHDELFASDALLLGRVTYQGFAAAWPSRTDDTGFADRINSLPKFVASTTLEKLAWSNARLLRGEVAQEVSELKRQPGRDILIYGSGALVRSLMRHGLIDEYRLLVYPVVLGSGKRLFGDGSAPTALRLVDTKTTTTGVVIATYQPAAPTAGRAT